MDTVEKEIDVDIDKQYVFNQVIHIEQMDDRYVIIDVNNANWLVLQNVRQLEIFKQLQQQIIGQVLEQNMSSICTEAEENAFMEDFLKVLTEIEAKEFEKSCYTSPYHDGLTLYLTNRCNLRCVHCFMYSGNALENELSTKEVLSLLSQFKELGGSGVTFSGGEVTEREDLVEILTHSKKLGLKNIVLTNGVNWSADLINDVTPLIDEIQVSIDGYDERSNARVRGSGAFDKAIRTVNEFLKRKSKVRIAITPMLDINEDEKNEYIKFAQNLLEKFRDENLVIKFNKTTLNGRSVRPNAKENAFYSACVDEIIEVCYPGSAIQDFVENHRDNTIFNNCGYGGITIAANGEIYFCNRIYDVPCFGNIRKMGFSELVELSRKVREASNIDNLEPCKSCELRYICGGGCRIEYFKDFVENTDFSNDINKCRLCTPEYKTKLYSFMIESNELLYR